MNGDAESTPTDPSSDAEENAVALAADNLGRAYRALQAVRRSVRAARAEGRAVTAEIESAADFGEEFLAILRDNVRIIRNVSRREADTVRELEAVRAQRPRGWFAYVNGAIAAISGTSALGAAIQGHPYAALSVAVVTVLTAYFANTPLPFMRGDRDREPRR
jgi:hypothetical protein